MHPAAHERLFYIIRLKFYISGTFCEQKEGVKEDWPKKRKQDLVTCNMTKVLLI